MRLVTFTPRNNPAAAPSVGALVRGGTAVLDFTRRDLRMPSDLLACFDLDGAWLPRAVALAAGEPPANAVIGLDTIRLRAPVPRPGKLVCVGLNYRNHAAESKMPVPERPILFSLRDEQMRRFREGLREQAIDRGEVRASGGAEKRRHRRRW